MEHAKKMMLVDADLRNVKRYYSLLDENISRVLNRQDIADRDKLTLYQQALNKYLANRKTVEHELNQPIKVEVAPPKQPTVKDDFLTGLSEAEREKAEQILSDLTAYSPYDFDEKGRLVREGKSIKGSSLSELVTRELHPPASKKKQKGEPIGWEFFESFRKSKEKLTPGKRLRKKKVWEDYE
jgi:hypothetical protein